MSYEQNIQWFPGHMAKTKRQIENNLKLVDAVVEILDARIPVSSRNPDISELTINKPRIILLNKADVSNPTYNKKWVEYYESQGYTALLVDCKTGKGINQFVPALNKALEDKINAKKAKGMINPIMRVMILGIPNVGKSSFINRMNKQSKAKTADRPGVTRGNQWFTIGKGFEMLDTPGILWPKFEDKTVGERLALTGAIKDEIIDIESLSMRLLEILRDIKCEGLIERYKLQNENIDDIESYELLELIAKKRGMIISKGEADTERAAIMILDEFRAGKLGKITLELPN